MSPEIISYWAGIAVAILALAGVIYSAYKNPAGDIADAASKIVKPLSERVDELESINLQTQKQLNKSESEKVMLTAKIAELQSLIESIEKKHAKEIERVVAEANKENVSLRHEISGLKMREGKLRREYAELKQENEELSRRINRIRESLGTGPLSNPD
jgi:chromosome segregation ATPase